MEAVQGVLEMPIKRKQVHKNEFVKMSRRQEVCDMIEVLEI